MGTFLLVLLLFFVGIPLSILGLTFAPLLTAWVWAGVIMTFFGGWEGFLIWSVVSVAWIPLFKKDEPADTQ